MTSVFVLPSAVTIVELACVHLQVPEPVVCGVQDAEPVCFWLDLHVRVSCSIDQRCIHECFHHHGRVGSTGYQWWFPGRIDRVIVWVIDWRVCETGSRGTGPRGVVPPTEGVSPPTDHTGSGRACTHEDTRDHQYGAPAGSSPNSR